MNTVKVRVGGETLEGVKKFEEERSSIYKIWQEYARKYGALENVFLKKKDWDGMEYLVGLCFPLNTEIPQGFKHYWTAIDHVQAVCGAKNLKASKLVNKELKELPKRPGSYGVGKFIKMPYGITVDEEICSCYYSCGIEKFGDTYILHIAVEDGGKIPQIPEGCEELLETQYLKIRRDSKGGLDV